MKYLSFAIILAVAALGATLSPAQQPFAPASSNTPQQANSLPSATKPSATPQQVIRTETRTVRVDAVVTDKKGNYVSGLTASDFKVLEDNKERAITTFTSGSDPAA